MTTRPTSPEEQDARHLGALLRIQAEEAMGAGAPRMVGMLRLDRLAHSATPALRRSAGPRRLIAAAAIVALVVAAGIYRWGPSPLEYRISGGARVEAGYIKASSRQPVNLDFSDGSRIVAGPDSRLRVQSVNSRGATIALERGLTSLDIQHRKTTDWEVLAGPFSVRVVGTRFRAGWEPSEERFELVVSEGAVKVEGGSLSSPTEIRAGYRVVASGISGTFSVEPVAQPTPGSREPGNTTTAAAAPIVAPDVIEVMPPQGQRTPGAVLEGTPKPMPRETVLEVEASSPSPANPWAAAMVDGRFDDVVLEAQAMGVETCMATCSSADLRHLADAARYTRRFDLAQQALTVLRSRGAAHSADAAYLLGSVAESQGKYPVALRWFTQYVSEAPRGGFVEEATLGRLRCLERLGPASEAGRVAREYLQDHPSGVGVSTARRILEKH